MALTGWLPYVAGLLAGTAITIQMGANARLKEVFGEALPAVVVNSVVGVIVLIAIIAAMRTPWPDPHKLGGPWWAWAGGLMGALYGVASVLLARKLGAATLTALVVTGQLLCSVTLDHFGW